ncbi:DNA gyrase inhibitor YacG [Ephemeroptericola cinctiostellae]|uniref:DNA gyrase inhibitor YacG n=1 Tax=Ephemeroptericola cinctiostellae TaxID=2268024 RepID=A0A345D9X4_9BURK|nr:DNA gyrase inhibitor YacG [Ephemeroptericola cinctiostellae]AXF85162.1 DNA gyrase inhibitor YacG [Ephemeroptericola cinctiostellae]
MPQITCPTCGDRHEYDTTSPFRPFCSERCKLIDLGAWSQESYKIPVTQEHMATDLDDHVLEHTPISH